MEILDGYTELTHNDKELLDMLISLKSNHLKVIVDNDGVWVDDVVKDDVVGQFDKYGYELVHAIFEYLGVNVDFC